MERAVPVPPAPARADPDRPRPTLSSPGARPRPWLLAWAPVAAFGVLATQNPFGLERALALLALGSGLLLLGLTMFAGLRELRAADPEYLRRCARCFLKGLCEQCPAKSWTEHGTLDTPVEYLCAVTHAQSRHLGLLQPEETGWNCPDWKDKVTAM